MHILYISLHFFNLALLVWSSGSFSSSHVLSCLSCPPVPQQIFIISTLVPVSNNTKCHTQSSHYWPLLNMIMTFFPLLLSPFEHCTYISNFYTAPHSPPSVLIGFHMWPNVIGWLDVGYCIFLIFTNKQPNTKKNSKKLLCTKGNKLMLDDLHFFLYWKLKCIIILVLEPQEITCDLFAAFTVGLTFSCFLRLYIKLKNLFIFI